MARKRGGLAGIWDRNKKIIKPIATFAAGMVNPALGAALGAAMGGLDREGKSGIGFDLKQGAIGGLQGYGAGKLGAMAKSKLAGLFAPGATSGAATGAPATAGIGAGGSAVTAPARSSIEALMVPGGGAGGAVSAGAPAAAGGSWLARNAPIIATGLQAVGGVMGDQADREVRLDSIAAQREAADLQRQQFEYQKEQDRLERERRQRIAQLLMPLFNQQAKDLNLMDVRPPAMGA